MTEVKNMAEETMPEEIVTRKNPFCVISKTANENGWHDLQSNSAWSTNPYGDTFAIVPDELVESIMETYGYCDIELNEDGTEVVTFMATEIPELPEPEETATQLDLIEAQVTYTAMMTDTLLEVQQMFERIKKWYKLGIWSKSMVANAVSKGKLTEEQYAEIVGEPLN